MAVDNLKNYTQDQGFGMPLNIRRGNPNPLDNSEQYETIEEAHTYAATDPTAYVGQIIVVHNSDIVGGKPQAYMITDTNGTLEGISNSGEAPTITVEKTGRVATVQAHDKNGITTVYLTDGKDGANGKDGEDGYTPVIEVNADGYLVIDGESTIKIKGDKGDTGEGFKISNIFETIDDLKGETALAMNEGEMAVVKDGGRLFLKDSKTIYEDTPELNGWIEIGDFSNITAIKGDNGLTPHIGIVELEDGTNEEHWFIGDEDTGYLVRGIQGDKGDKGDKGDTGDAGYSPKVIINKKDNDTVLEVKIMYKDGDEIKTETKYINAGFFPIISSYLSTDQNTNDTGNVKVSYADNDGETQTKTLSFKIPTLYIDKENSKTTIYLNPTWKTVSNNDGFSIKVIDKYDAKQEITDGKSADITVTELNDGVKRFEITKTDGATKTVDINSGWTPDFSFNQDADNDHLYHMSIEDVNGQIHSADLSSCEIEVGEKVNNHYTLTVKDGVHESPQTLTIYDGLNAYDDSEITQRITDLEDDLGDFQTNGATYTDESGVVVAIGGWKIGDTANKMSFQDFAYKLLHPYIAPSVTINIDKNSLQPAGTTLDKVTVTVNVTKKSQDISTVRIYAGSVALSLDKEVTAGSNTYTASISNVTYDTTFKAVVDDTESSVTQIASVKFVGYSYYGIVGADITAPTSDNIKSLSNTLKSIKDYSYTGITLSNQKICYAYPSSFGTISKIKDPATNYDYINSFNRTTVNIDGIEYYCYLLKDGITVSDTTLYFS